MFRFLLLVGYVGLTHAETSINAGITDQLLTNLLETNNSTEEVTDAHLDVPALVAKYGYAVESHEVVTEDGYILTVHRIPHGKENNNQSNPKKIAIVWHGLLCSSADYILLGPGKALGYILADHGYDTWIPNSRGNYYSRRHISLDPDRRLNNNFWKFSWDEMGNYDLPAVLDYIENHTGQSRYYYIEHSQGGASFFVGTTMQPELNKRFISAHLMAPAVIFEEANTGLFLLSLFNNLLQAVGSAVSTGEVLGRNTCGGESVSAEICKIFVNETFINSENINDTTKPVVLGHFPAGSSINQFAHFAQCIATKKFIQFDHGPVSNLAKYGSIIPPTYDLSKTSTPCYLYLGENDYLVHPKNIYILASKLTNLKGLYKVDLPSFGHFDFLYASKANELVYDKLLTDMKEAEGL